jgi:hypothetical protein
MPLFVLQIAEGGPAAVDGRLNVSYTYTHTHTHTGAPKAGVHKSRAGMPGQLNFLQWSLIFLGSLEVVLCYAVGDNSFEVTVIFVENLCTFVIKVTSPRLYMCSVETVLYF